MSAYQIAEWEAYDIIDPIGEERADIRMASLETLIFNLAIMIHAKKGTKLSHVEEFIPKWGEEDEVEPEVQSVEEMKNFMLNFAQLHNASFKRKTTGLDKPPKRPIEPHKNYEP